MPTTPPLTAEPSHTLHPAFDGLTVLERGWLSSNNIIIHAAPGEAGAVLVDTGHVNHAPQTLALVRHALAGRPLACIANTHLHSDHCGGNALLAQAFAVPVLIPPGEAEAVSLWDEDRLSYRATDQRIARFEHHPRRLLNPGTPLRAGGRDWQVLAAPGHDPHSVILFDATHGVLISADALWENGFGVVFPEAAGEPGFADVGATLDLIAGLAVRWVIPGHGAPFSDVAGALERARSRLASFQAQPARHARHAVKVLTRYHVMERGAMPLVQLVQWVQHAPLLAQVQQRFVAPGGQAAWVQALVQELVQQGALVLRDGVVHDGAP